MLQDLILEHESVCLLSNLLQVLYSGSILGFEPIILIQEFFNLSRKPGSVKVLWCHGHLRDWLSGVKVLTNLSSPWQVRMNGTHLFTLSLCRWTKAPISSLENTHFHQGSFCLLQARGIATIRFKPSHSHRNYNFLPFIDRNGVRIVLNFDS